MTPAKSREHLGLFCVLQGCGVALFPRGAGLGPCERLRCAGPELAGGSGPFPTGDAIACKGLLLPERGSEWEGKNDLFSSLPGGEEQHSAAYPLDVTVGSGFVLRWLALPEPKRLARDKSHNFFKLTGSL